MKKKLTSLNQITKEEAQVANVYLVSRGNKTVAVCMALVYMASDLNPSVQIR